MKQIKLFLRENAAWILFFTVYTAAFFLVAKNIRFTLPFLLGILLGAVSCPIARFLKRRLHLSGRVSVYASVLCVYISVFLALSALLGWLCREVVQLFSGEGYFAFTDLSPAVQDYLTTIMQRFPSVENVLQSYLSAFLPAIQKILSFCLSLPALFVLPILSFLISCFLLQQRRSARRGLIRWLGPRFCHSLRAALRRRSKTSAGLLTAYFLLYLITFCESILILYLLQLPYPVLTAILITLADLIPVLGPGAVMLPIALYRFLCGMPAQALGLVFGWLLITVIRQVVEPRLLSKITRTPGTLMLIAVYASLLSGNFWLIPYTTLLCFLVDLLSDAGVLKRSGAAAGPEKESSNF